MRDRVLALAGRFDWVFKQKEWGPGRVDTFNSAKVIFNFPMAHLDPKEFDAPADFPSIWRQRQRKEPKEMQLHWDGNNTTVEERNKSAAFGTGTTPPTIDIARIRRVDDWIMDVTPPHFSDFFPIDDKLAAKGAPIYKEYCAACHGASGSDFSGEHVGQVVPLAKIGTDRRRLDSYTYTLAVNQATLYAGYPWRFTHFQKTHGYANKMCIRDRADTADAIDRITGGLAEFVSAADRQRLVDALGARPDENIQYHAPCRMRPGASRWSVGCQPGDGNSGLKLTATLDKTRAHGRVAVSYTHLGPLQWNGHVGPPG